MAFVGQTSTQALQPEPVHGSLVTIGNPRASGFKGGQNLGFVATPFPTK
jgi:hypothetical protein